MRPRSPAFAAALALPGLAGCIVTVGEVHEPTPQRPSFSSDTATTAFATFEVETGLAIDPGDFLDTPTTVKFGAAPDVELFVGFSPYVRIDADQRPDPGEGDGQGIGDHVLGARYRFFEGPADDSAAIQAELKIPTADEDEDLGSGELDAFVAGIYTRALDQRTSATVFGQVGMVGDPDGGADRRHALALAATYGLDARTSAAAEIAGIHHTDGADPLFATLGFARTIQPGTVVDLGIALGLNDDAPDAVLLIGLTTNLGHLFPPPPHVDRR